MALSDPDALQVLIDIYHERGEEEQERRARWWATVLDGAAPTAEMWAADRGSGWFGASGETWEQTLYLSHGDVSVKTSATLLYLGGRLRPIVSMGVRYHHITTSGIGGVMGMVHRGTPTLTVEGRPTEEAGPWVYPSPSCFALDDLPDAMAEQVRALAALGETPWIPSVQPQRQDIVHQGREV